MSAAETSAPGGEARDRLVEAMAAVVAENGYPAARITDVVARARVSRRTFYEQFADKDECLAACIIVMRDHMLEAIKPTLAKESHVGLEAPQHVKAAVDALVAALIDSPNYTKTYFLTAQVAGPHARRARRDAQSRLGEVLPALAGQHRAQDPRIKVPSVLMTTAVVGGIGELIVQTLEHGRVGALNEIAPAVAQLITAVIYAPD